MSDLYAHKLGTWKIAHIPRPITGFTVSGLQAHAMTRSGYGHAEEPEWVYGLSFAALEREHFWYHANGGKHRK